MNYDLKALDKALDARIKEKKLPGVSCAIYGPDGVIFEKGYGFGNNEHTKLIDENTIFGIASMSKSTSTLALAILEAEGKFSYDDPVTKYIPSFRIPGNHRRHTAHGAAGMVHRHEQHRSFLRCERGDRWSGRILCRGRKRQLGAADAPHVPQPDGQN